MCSSLFDAQLPPARRGVFNAGTAGWTDPLEVEGVPSAVGGVYPDTLIGSTEEERYTARFHSWLITEYCERETSVTPVRYVGVTADNPSLVRSSCGRARVQLFRCYAALSRARYPPLSTSLPPAETTRLFSLNEVALRKCLSSTEKCQEIRDARASGQTRKDASKGDLKRVNGNQRQNEFLSQIHAKLHS